MIEAFVLLLVFSAVGWAVWVAIPMLVGIGTWYAGADTGLAASDPAFRTVVPHKLLQSCWASAISCGGGAGAVILATGLFGWLGATVASGLVGWVAYQLPKVWVRQRFKKRRLLFEARLMDLTLGLSNGLRSGASFPQSLDIVARDIGGPVSEEFNLVLQEYRLGVDLSEAISRLCKRMPSEDLALLMSAVRLTMQAGGSLADVLDKITETIRQRTEFQEKLKTMTSQGKFEAIAMAAAPLAAFLILYAIDSDLMRPLIVTQAGWCAIGVVIALEIIGFMFIKKIVTIEV